MVNKTPIFVNYEINQIHHTRAFRSTLNKYEKLMFPKRMTILMNFTLHG